MYRMPHARCLLYSPESSWSHRRQRTLEYKEERRGHSLYSIDCSLAEDCKVLAVEEAEVESKLSMNLHNNALDEAHLGYDID